MMIPVGFRFEPTDEELIRGFLLQQVMGVALPWNGIIERKVYGDDAMPWVVFSDAGEPSSIYWNSKIEGGMTKDSTYVFTTLRRVPNHRNIPRTAGGGKWGGQTSPKKIKNSDTGAIIGNSRMYAFESTKFDVSLSSELGHWIMHEYALAGAALEAAGLTDGCDLVICKITRCIKKSGGGGVPRAPLQPPLLLPCKRAAEECPDQEEEETCRKKQRYCDGEGFFHAAAMEAVGGEGFLDVLATEVVGGEGFLDALAMEALGGEGFLDAPATEGVGGEGFLDALATEGVGGEGFLDALTTEAVGGDGFLDALATEATEGVGGEGFLDAPATEVVGGEGFLDAAGTEAVGDFEDPDLWLNNLAPFLDDSGLSEGIIGDDFDDCFFPYSGVSPTLQGF